MMATLRHRLLEEGPESMTTDELLALLAGQGTSPEAALACARQLLSTYGGLGGLLRADVAELASCAGLGKARVSQVKAALELGRRLTLIPTGEKYHILKPADAAKLVMPEMAHLQREQMRVLTLDSKQSVIENRVLYQGTVSSAILRVAEVYRSAVLRHGSGVVVCHNHPSGDSTPSPEDLSVTEQLLQAGKTLDIELVDHLIIGDQCFVSLREQMRW